MKLKRLLLREFKAWVLSKPYRKFKKGCRNCPIASYMASTSPGIYKMYVDGFNMSATFLINGVYTDTPSRALPKWAERFIEKYDNLDVNRPTVKHVMEVLASI